MLSRMASASDDTPTLLILGSGGDLTHRLLLPGLATLLTIEKQRRVRVIGADRVDLTPQEWTGRVQEAFTEAGATKTTTNAVLRTTAYVKTDLLDLAALEALIATCGDGPLVIFFALPPAVSVKVCELLRHLSLPEVTRLALEKPFGTDLESARRFNRLLARVVPEKDIYRIDHFLGVNSVLNVIGLRFANRLLQPIWSSEHIAKVEIVYDEDLALEGRAGYYDKAGALRDMIQSHLLQVLALVAMEPIAVLDAEELQDLKAQVLRSVHLWEGDPVTASRRARYQAGKIGERRIPSYVKEPGVDPTRGTETLAELTVGVQNNRWAGIPFVLRSGKAMGAPRKEIVVTFRGVPHLPTGFAGPANHDRLVIGLKPGDVRLSLTMNAEGDPLDLEQKELSATLAPPRMRPYGEVLGMIFDGEQLLTVRGDAAEQCWRIVDPVLAAFADGRVPLDTYRAGSSGPRGW